MEWQGVALIVAALLGTGGIGAVIRNNTPKGQRENALIDQYQQQAAEQDARMRRLELRADAAVRREHIRDDYIMELRRHIADSKPPPPPPWPSELAAFDGGHTTT